jgi:histidine kinase
MSLVWKFFISYVVVVAIGLLVLSLSVAYVAPSSFSQSVEHMMMGARAHAGEDAGEMGHAGPGGMMAGGILVGSTSITNDELDASFRSAVNSALWKAAGAAILAAGIVSGIGSLYILRPLRRVAGASQHIAEGHYDQRLPVSSRDELGDLVENFNRMAETLAENETMRRQLIGDVSHELKTPLASIKGYMEGLEDGVIAPTAETFRLVHQEADRLQRLVYDLQELSRSEVVSSTLDLHPADPGKLIAAVVDRLQPQFADKGITLAVEVPPVLPSVPVDADRIEQVLTNLLGNALQYTPAGGQVAVRAASHGAALRVSVQDSGVGLAPGDLAKVFQRFYRVDKSRSRASGGSGIGLTIAKHIVDAHGGRIWAESDGPDQGSMFIFTLPLK